MFFSYCYSQFIYPLLKIIFHFCIVLSFFILQLRNLLHDTFNTSHHRVRRTPCFFIYDKNYCFDASVCFEWRNIQFTSKYFYSITFECLIERTFTFNFKILNR